MEKKFYTAKYDRVFKTIFCSNEKLLKEFMERLLDIKIDTIEYLRNEINVNNVNEKVKTVDLLLLINKEYYHIEINTNHDSFIPFRNLLYFFSIIINNVKRGKTYDNKTNFVHIDLSYGLKNNNQIKNVFYLQDENGNKYVDNIKAIVYNMDVINNLKDEELIQKYKFLMMLDMQEDELKKLIKGDDLFMKEFSKKVLELNSDEKWPSLFTREEDYEICANTKYKEGMEKGLEEGMEKGLEEGKENTKFEIAREMKKKNFNIKDIIEITKLSENQIMML